MAECEVNGEVVPCDEMWSQYGWIFGIVGFVFFALAVFWIWMFVNLLRSSRKDKLVWVLVLLFGSVPGAILYFFIAKGKSSENPG